VVCVSDAVGLRWGGIKEEWRGTRALEDDFNFMLRGPSDHGTLQSAPAETPVKK